MRNIRKPEFSGYERSNRDNEEAQLESGRDIAGIESHPVLLSVLKPEEYKVSFRNENIASAVPGVTFEDFLYMIDNTKKIGVAVMGEAPHWRNVATPGDTVYTDEEGKKQYFFEVATKGIGMVKSEVLDNYDYDSLATRNEYDVQINLGHSEQADYNMNEGDLIELDKRLIAMGIRSEMYWVIAKVDKVSFNGELYNVADAREQGIIHKNRQLNPYLGVRVLRTNHRIEEFAKGDDARRHDILLRVFDNFNKETRLTGRNVSELSPEKSEDLQKYFMVVCEQHITNLAKLVSNALVYYHMHSSNLTMMGEIVDTGVLAHIYHDNDPERIEDVGGIRVGYAKDMRDCVLGLRNLLRALSKYRNVSFNREEVASLIISTFNTNFDAGVFIKSDKKAKPDKVKEVFSEIVTRMMIDRKTLPALKHNSIEDWGLESLK